VRFQLRERDPAEEVTTAISPMTRFPSMNFEAKGGLPNGSAELRAHRDAVGGENEPEMLKDLQEVFGKPAARRSRKKSCSELVKKIQDNKLSMEDLKNRKTMQTCSSSRAIRSRAAQYRRSQASSREDRSARRCRRGAEDRLSQRTEAERDLPEAARLDPVTFVRIRGSKVDSDEFANAVYDMQEALHIKADGILGDDTLVAFYDQNKKKPDIFYDERPRRSNKRRRPRRSARKKTRPPRTRRSRTKPPKTRAASRRHIAGRQSRC